MSEKFSLKVKSQMEQLGVIADFVENAARASGLNDHQIYDVQMAVDEACSNVVEHAYSGKSNGTIEVTCGVKGKDFIVTIRDHGKPFDPSKVARPKTNAPLAERTIGGLGLFFMYKMMDHVKFAFSPTEGNLLTMSKKIKR